MNEEKELSYAWSLPQGTQRGALERHKTLCSFACQTCGYPYVQAGDLCPPCEELVADCKKRDEERAADVLNEILRPDSRFVHVYGVGYVDPWTREGKQLLDP